MTALTVIAAGPQTLIQDAGRPGLARLGVGGAGAMDRGALALANRLVGNESRAASLEVLLGGLELTATHDTWIAVTGAWGPIAIDGAAVEPHTATPLAAEATLRLGPAAQGIRYFLAVRGGIDVDRVLGSRSRDTLAALGPLPLANGDVVPIGPLPTTRVPSVDLVPVDPPPAGAVTLHVGPGPRAAWFRGGYETLLAGDWQVSPRSDRTGIRLDGPELTRTHPAELPSEGMVHGGIQVSPDGVPTILGPDHPVTGGYPVIAVVSNVSLDALAQLRPGQPLRFV